jgi:multimeric flavodoxin WrbA
MARIMVVQGSGRRRGFTASLMNDVVAEMRKIEGIEVEIYHLHNYIFGPCKSCFFCIRNVGSGCCQDDDWGRKGKGDLYQAFMRANGLLMVDPVHGWGMSAASRVFIERIYPTFWVGTPYGLPFASISCASNQGFQTRAVEEFSKFSAAKGFRYIGGLPVHVAYLKEARADAVALGGKLTEAALADERCGRKKLTDEEIFLMYMDTPWSIVRGYIDNLTNGTFRYETSVPVRALKDGVFTNPEARPLLEKTCESLKRALERYDAGDTRAAAIELSKTSKFWTNATFIQFLRDDVVKAEMPKAYRPLDELEE